jgi:membrane-bound serine protease (ClpP class)
MNRWKILLLACMAISALSLSPFDQKALFGQQGKNDQPLVYILEVDGTINPAVADYIAKGVEKAVTNKAACVIIRLDTPGGNLTTTKTIIKEMVNAKVPVVVYVGPSGSSATSAGALITMAADVAAMAPGTNIGAAHPVQGGGQDISGTMSDKVLNDLTAYMRGIVTKKGRNAEWGERAIRESVSVTAKEALDIKVIDLIADSVPELLEKLNGRTIDKEGSQLTFNTKGARVERIAHGWRFAVLDVIANPNIAYILMMIGGLGIMMEMYSPGLIFPGVVGGICLLLSLFALQVLPVSSVGIMLIILSVILFILELKVHSFGLLSASAIISLVLGSIMMFETDESAMRVSWSVILPTVVTVSAFFIVALGLVVRARLSRPRTGQQGMVGEVGVALTDINVDGKVAVHGEYWNARAERFIPKGERVKVVGVEGMVVVVTPDVGR